ncbi:MAG: hypothetical protein IKM38_08365 [Christensenellaceae bacterium]|nr:hypothetical protein [Christensenellaceae bacterium]MBR3843263.1 hypothetical protein [Christensenellaceae bacterium]
MSKLYTADECDLILMKYYIEQFGDRDTDTWMGKPADNIWKFVRSGYLITLEVNTENGEILTKTEELTID